MTFEQPAEKIASERYVGGDVYRENPLLWELYRHFSEKIDPTAVGAALREIAENHG